MITHLNLNQSFLRVDLKKVNEASKTIDSAIKTRTPRNLGCKENVTILEIKIETPKKETPQIKETFRERLRPNIVNLLPINIIVDLRKQSTSKKTVPF